MKWARTFKAIALADGRILASLEAAREFLIALEPSARDGRHWRYAEDLLQRAAERNEKYSTMDARSQLIRALQIEGLLATGPARSVPPERRDPDEPSRAQAGEP